MKAWRVTMVQQCIPVSYGVCYLFLGREDGRAEHQHVEQCLEARADRHYSFYDET